MQEAAIATVEVADLERARCERLAESIGELSSCLYAAEHRLLALIREFDDKQGWAYRGFPSCAHWLNFQCGMDGNTARERIRVAHALVRLPKIDVAFSSGALSYSKVRAMTRIADEDNEDYLLMIAKHGTAHHVEQLVRKYRRVRALQEGEAESEVDGDTHDERRLNYRYDSDGSLVIRGRLPAEQGALIVKALERAMEKDFADVSAETPEERTPAACRQADALAGIAETYLNAEPVANSTADRYQVVVHVSAETRGGGAHIEGGPGVSSETARRIACDCSLLRVVEDQAGEPLSIRRKSRSIPPAIRRALRFRDRGCRFPGCTHDRFVDGHHIVHWADGGETGLDNLVLLCRHHHRLVHGGGFTCEKDESGKIVFRDQRQEPLPRYPVVPTIAGDDLDDRLEREFFDRGIDANTCRAQWYAGERMDWGLAVANLFQ